MQSRIFHSIVKNYQTILACVKSLITNGVLFFVFCSQFHFSQFLNCPFFMKHFSACCNSTIQSLIVICVRCEMFLLEYCFSCLSLRNNPQSHEWQNGKQVKAYYLFYLSVIHGVSQVDNMDFVAQAEAVVTLVVDKVWCTFLNSPVDPAVFSRSSRLTSQVKAILVILYVVKEG